MMDSKRKPLEILRAQLENNRASFLQHWRDLGDHILPRRPRFYTADINRGERRNQKIIDSTATLAVRTLRSGMMSGITSPARPWFRLTTPDPDLAEFGPVKQWLYLVDQRMATVFLRSNLYNALPILYGDLGVFGTSAMGMEEDFDNVVRFYPFAIGSYCLSTNPMGKVDTFFRDFQMTVRQIVEKFGRKPNGEIDWTNISYRVKEAWEIGQKEMWVDVCHFIMPNDEWSPGKLDSKFKKYKSVYYERGLYQGMTYEEDPFDKVLSEKGYDLFPILAPRWEVTGEDAYATSCPGMDSLGDIRQLQMGEKRSMQAIEKMVNPPMIAPSSLRTGKTSILPGDVTFVDVREGMKGFQPAHEVDPRIRELEEKQIQVRQRIQRAFYEDLFLMIANSDRRDITAREIEERHEEKLLALGPVLEQLNQDLLDPLIDGTFEIMNRQGLIPSPPEELQGMPLKVEYISMMAQAQKLAGLSGYERFFQFVGSILQVNPQSEVMDKVDIDKGVEHYADMTSIPPDVIRSDDDVQAIRQGRAKQAQAQQAAATAKDAASAANTLGNTPMDKNSALSQLLDASNAGAVQ